MKKFLLLSAFAIACISVNATVRTVSNFPSNVAQFNAIDPAVAASAAGDTILVQGSPIDYAVFTLDRKVTIIGPGWSPNKQLGFTAKVNGLNFSSAAASGTEIQGLVFNGEINQANDFNLDNIRFIRNHFEVNVSLSINRNNSTYSNFLFEGNLFSESRITGASVANYSNFLIQNNIFMRFGTTGGSLTGFFKTNNILFNHNLFYGGGAIFFNRGDGENRFLSLTNNIFVNVDVNTSISSSIFSNNITFNCANNAPWNNNSNVNSGNTNIENQDPQMADQAVVNAGTNNPLANFTVAAGPANNSGSDGKDRGLLFDATGSLNWINSRMARLPFINIMDIINPTLAPGGNVQVTVEAKTNN